MRRSLCGFAAAAVALALPSPAAAQGVPCPELSRATCTNVAVPLDRTGRVPGTVNLAAARVPASRGPSQGTLLFLAGGPGQSALPALPTLSRLAARFAPNYDLVAFDQRGTGRSSRLRCSALGGSGGQVSVFARCGAQLGAARGFYRSADSADDIEAVRRAFGSPQLRLFGVSYGGRVAGEYVRRYPASVARMVLDSPSTLTGTDPFAVVSQRSLPRIFSAICARGACNSITRRPYTDVARLASQLRRKPLAATVFTASGSRIRGRLTQGDLFALVFLSDLDPVARAELPGAVRAARSGDGAALARALLRAVASAGSVSAAQEDDSGVSDEVFAATTCAEGPLPWATNSPVGSGRERAADRRVRQLGSRAFRPFSASTVVSGNAILAQCLRWPPVAPTPVAATRGPAVPTLVLSGQEDIRTPLANAQRIARQYPGGRVLQVPGYGHSTISTDATLCAARSTFGFLTTGAAPASCPFSRPVRVAPRPPRRLGDVTAKSSKARIERTVRLTVRDLARSIVGGSSARFGGLRGGRATLTSSTRVVLASYQYVPGFRVSGVLRVRSGRLVGTLTASGAGAKRTRVSLDSKGNARAASVAAAGVELPQRVERLPTPSELPAGISRFVREAASR